MVALGAVIDVAHGWVRLGTGADSARFYRGEFTPGAGAAGATQLTLTGGTPCGSSASGSHRGARPLRAGKLWGTGHGRFTTVGRFAAASVIGTHWLTWNTCAGTEIRVAAGEVRVTDLVRHRTFVLRAPHSYVAKP